MSVVTSKDIKREKTMSSLIALKKHNQEQKESKEKIKTLKSRIETLKKKTETLKSQVNDLKIALVNNEEAHKVAKVKVQELGTQLKVAQAKQREMGNSPPLDPNC